MIWFETETYFASPKAVPDKQESGQHLLIVKQSCHQVWICQATPLYRKRKSYEIFLTKVKYSNVKAKCRQRDTCQPAKVSLLTIVQHQFLAWGKFNVLPPVNLCLIGDTTRSISKHPLLQATHGWSLKTTLSSPVTRIHTYFVFPWSLLVHCFPFHFIENNEKLTLSYKVCKTMAQFSLIFCVTLEI